MQASSCAVVISLAKAHHQNNTSIVYCLRLKLQRDLGELRPYGHPFPLHADGNKFVIRNDFLREEEIDVGKLIVLRRSGCRYHRNTGYHWVSLWYEDLVGFSLRALAIAEITSK